ncbi:hypothetical protein [Streptomyces sp. NPDC050263]|uniref:hypothetical protein n=1 Tax=Streptomyces sp. NPDC050263 TaxID=3155037 RepID=UPI0034154B76
MTEHVRGSRAVALNAAKTLIPTSRLELRRVSGRQVAFAVFAFSVWDPHYLPEL